MQKFSTCASSQIHVQWSKGFLSSSSMTPAQCAAKVSMASTTTSRLRRSPKTSSLTGKSNKRGRRFEQWLFVLDQPLLNKRHYMHHSSDCSLSLHVIHASPWRTFMFSTLRKMLFYATAPKKHPGVCLTTSWAGVLFSLRCYCWGSFLNDWLWCDELITTSLLVAVKMMGSYRVMGKHFYNIVLVRQFQDFVDL